MNGKGRTDVFREVLMRLGAHRRPLGRDKSSGLGMGQAWKGVNQPLPFRSGMLPKEWLPSSLPVQKWSPVFSRLRMFLMSTLPQHTDRLFIVLDPGYYSFGIVASIEPRTACLLGKCSTIELHCAFCLEAGPHQARPEPVLCPRQSGFSFCISFRVLVCAPGTLAL